MIISGTKFSKMAAWNWVISKDHFWLIQQDKQSIKSKNKIIVTCKETYIKKYWITYSKTWGIEMCLSEPWVWDAYNVAR